MDGKSQLERELESIASRPQLPFSDTLARLANEWHWRQVPPEVLNDDKEDGPYTAHMKKLSKASGPCTARPPPAAAAAASSSSSGGNENKKKKKNKPGPAAADEPCLKVRRLGK